MYSQFTHMPFWTCKCTTPNLLPAHSPRRTYKHPLGRLKCTHCSNIPTFAKDPDDAYINLPVFSNIKLAFLDGNDWMISLPRVHKLRTRFIAVCHRCGRSWEGRRPEKCGAGVERRLGLKEGVAFVKRALSMKEGKRGRAEADRPISEPLSEPESLRWRRDLKRQDDGVRDGYALHFGNVDCEHCGHRVCGACLKVKVEGEEAPGEWMVRYHGAV